jgi:hypothetical protein
MEKRIRSPNYPALGLQEAINRTAALYKVQHTHLAPREVVAKGMGYSGLNGASATAVSALIKYGLLEREGEDLKVSERAMRILHPHNPDEKASALREAALSPPLFAELMERFPGQMPNEDLLRNYLVRKGFAEAALSPVISAYRETSEIVSRENPAYETGLNQQEDTQAMQFSTQANASLGGARPAANPSALIAQTIEKNTLDRTIGRYDFEGGAYVRIAASDDLETEAALDMVETLIQLKRAELKRKKQSTVVLSPVDNGKDENGEN